MMYARLPSTATRHPSNVSSAPVSTGATGSDQSTSRSPPSASAGTMAYLADGQLVGYEASNPRVSGDIPKEDGPCSDFVQGDVATSERPQNHFVADEEKTSMPGDRRYRLSGRSAGAGRQMIESVILASAFAATLGAATATAQIIPIDQTREVNVYLQWMTSEDEGGDGAGDSAFDFSAFDPFVAATTGSPGGFGDSSAQQQSLIGTDSVEGYGYIQQSIQTESGEEEWEGRAISTFDVSFQIDEAIDFTLTGSVGADAGAQSSIYFSSTTETIYQTSGAAFDESGTLEPGTYFLTAEVSADFFDVGPVFDFNQAAFDFVLQLGDALSTPGTTGAADVVLGAHPSPARHTTEITFGAGVDAIAGTVSIFDASGRIVRQLARTAGARSVQWDTRDAAGRSVAPGVYFVRADDLARGARGRVLIQR